MQVKYGVLAAALLAAIATTAPAEEKAAEQGNTLEAMISQGRELLSSGNQEQMKQAVSELQQAAKAHSAEAQRLLGEAYSKGLGVEKNLARAFEHYADAARQLDPVAQYEVAKAYFTGQGTDANMISAYMWATLSQLKESSVKEQAVKLRDDISKLLTAEQIEKARMLSDQLQQIYLKTQ